LIHSRCDENRSYVQRVIKSSDFFHNFFAAENFDAGSADPSHFYTDKCQERV
jgi:hypothetical protein